MPFLGGREDAHGARPCWVSCLWCHLLPIPAAEGPAHSTAATSTCSRGLPGSEVAAPGRGVRIVFCPGVLCVLCQMSEGLDFSDAYGRAVVITGIPYATKTDARVRTTDKDCVAPSLQEDSPSPGAWAVFLGPRQEQYKAGAS